MTEPDGEQEDVDPQAAADDERLIGEVREALRKANLPILEEILRDEPNG